MMLSPINPRNLLSLVLLAHTSLACISASFIYEQKNSRLLIGQIWQTVDTSTYVDTDIKCGIAITRALPDGDGQTPLQCLDGYTGIIGRDFGDYWWFSIKREWAPGHFDERKVYLNVKDNGGDKRAMDVQIYGCPGVAPNWQEVGVATQVVVACDDGREVVAPAEC